MSSSAKQLIQRVDLFSVATTPYKGLKSDSHPLALKPGEAFDAKNLRAEPGKAIRVRDGIALELDTAGLPAGAVFWGASEMVKVQDGFWLIYAAIEDPATLKIDVYNRQYTTASGWGSQWYRLTESSGAFGDTRLTKPTQGLVTFTPVDSDPRAREHLTYVGPTASKGPAVIVQNGIDRPLHVVGYPNAASTQNRAVPINPIDTPVAARATVPEAGVFDSLPVVAGAATATASAGGAFTAATGGSVGASGGSWVWTTGNAVVVGDWGQIVMDTDSMSVLGGPDLRAVPQIGLVVEADDDSWWDAVKLWANVNYDGGGYGWELIHDPTAPPGSAKNNRVHVLTNKTGVVVSAYAFDDKSHGGYSLASINGLKIEVADALLSAASTFRVHWVYASGWVPGTAQYAVARKAGLSESESGGVFLSQGAFGETTTFLRTAATTSAGTTLETSNARFLHPMFQSGNVPTDFVFPIDARLFYHYRVPVVNPWMVELSGAYADTWSVYRKDPGDAEFYLAYDLQVGVYNSILQTWGLTNGSEGGIYSSEDAVPPERKDYRRRVPDTYNEPTPIGQAGVFVDKRLYSGTLVKDPQGDNFVCGSVMVSEEGYPGRFRRYGRFDSGDNDPSSGYEVRLGAEEVMALGVLQGSGSAQVTSVYCVTDRAFYSIDRVLNGNRLFNIRRIAPSGTQSRRGTASMGTELYWLDQVRALRSTQSGLPDLSQASVQDRLDAVVDWDGVCVSTFRNRLFIARGERVLTYIAGYWESDDELPVGKGVIQFLEFAIDGGSRLLYFAPDAAVYEYARPLTATDEGAAINFTIESAGFHNHSFEPVVAQRVGVVGTTCSTVLATKRTFGEPPVIVDGTLDLQDGAARAWKYDQTATGGVPGGEGHSVRVRVEGDFHQPFELIALVAEIEGADLGGPRV